MSPVGWLRKTVPGNERVQATVYTVPDAWGRHMAQLGVYTNTASPASTGVNTPNSPLGYVAGVAGYGVNRATDFLSYPLQRFGQPTAPVISPAQANLGIGAGVSGQPGLPSTGQGGDSPADSALAWMSFSPLGRVGIGG